MMDDTARVVKNRDIPTLQRVYGLMQDIVSLENRRQWERERMQNITAHLSGTPGGGRIPHGLDDAFAAVAETEEKHKLLVKQYARELRRAEEIINTIPNESMRTFVTMLYLDNVPNTEVRELLNMTRRGFDSARNAVEQAECMADVVWHERFYVNVDGEG